MRKNALKYLNLGLSVLVGIGIFLFWYVAYPHTLSYQEQYQLFLWTGDYFLERVSLPGGFADWLGEFIVQFYYVEWLGALLLALLTGHPGGRVQEQRESQRTGQTSTETSFMDFCHLVFL